MTGSLQLLAGFALLAAWSLTAYGLAARALPEARCSARLAVAAAVGGWLLIAVFELLAAWGLFRLTVVLPLWILAAALAFFAPARGPDPLSRLLRDRSHGEELLRRLSASPLLLALIPLLLVAGVRLFRGLVAPPLAWDALTYHLLKAARWVQGGGWVPERAPGAWDYYESFLPGGDIPWAWAMLPTRSDALLAPAGALLALTVALASYAAAVALGAERRPALLTAAAITGLPSVSSFLTSAYVHNLTLAALVLSVALLHLALREDSDRLVFAASCALGLLAASQHLGLLPALGGLLLLVARTSWTRREARWRGLALALTGPLVVVPPLARAWFATGNPFYPLGLTVGRRTLFAGSPALEELLASDFAGLAPIEDSLGALLATLFSGRAGAPGLDPLNFTPGAALLVALGGVGLARLARGRRGRSAAGLLLLLAVLSGLPVFLPGSVAQRTLFAFVAGRLLAGSVAVLMVSGALVPGRPAQLLRAGVVAVAAVWAWPRGLGGVDRQAMAALAPWLLAALAGAWAVNKLGRYLRAPAWGGCLAVTLALATVGAGLPPIRSHFRYRIYAATVHAPPDRSFDVDPLPPPLAASWPAWQLCDEDEPRRIAFTAGWDRIGHHWTRYPLLGERLQNRVFYVPVTASGEIVSYAPDRDLDRVADPEAWIGRLVEEQIDLVVLGPPRAPELPWILSRPELFVPLPVPGPSPTRVFGFYPPPRP